MLGPLQGIPNREGCKCPTIIGENTLVKRCKGLQGQISQKIILWLKTSGYNKYKINSGVLDKLSIEKIYGETLMDS